MKEPRIEDLKRYSPGIRPGTEVDTPGMHPDAEGKWVRYEDYEKLKEEKAQLDRYADTLNKDIDEMEAELLELRYETRHLR